MLCVRSPEFRWLATALFFMSAYSALAGGGECLATGIPTRIPCGTCEESDRFVRLQVRPVETALQDAVRFSHPVHLDPEDWAVLLRRIRVQSRPEGFLFGSTKGPVTEAFTADEIQFLSRSLSKAFAEARSEEVIVFGLARPRTPEVTEITTGSWFAEGAVLHLVMANHRTAVTLPGIRTLLWEDPLRTQTGLLYEFVPGEHQRLVRGKDENLFGSPRPSEVALEYRAILLQGLDSPPAVQMAPSTGSSSSLSALPPEPPLSLEERLRRLKRLREQGLITEEEYGAKKKELLDRL